MEFLSGSGEMQELSFKNDKIKENAERSRMEYFIWDGTHPTIAGHMVIAREWLKAVEE